LKSFLLMIVYFTRIPIRYRYDYNEKDLSKGIILFPLIGVIIGLFAFIPALIEVFFSTVQSELSGLEVIELLFKNSFLTQNHAFSTSRYITAVISWLLYVWITGGLHIDGLADTFDGFFSNRDKNRIFEIMQDSRIGTFGVLGIVMVSLINVVMLANLPLIYIIIFPVVGRVVVIITCSNSQYAKPVKGMGTTFVEACTVTKAFFSFLMLVAIILVVVYWSCRLDSVIAIILLSIISFFILKWIKSKIGGMTGDTCGFMIEISQSIFFVLIYYIGKFSELI